jgi:hypothetical protein
MARAYLSAHDAKMSTRTWSAVMREIGTHGIASSQERCARTFCSKAFDSIRHKPLVQTTAEDLLSIVHNHGHSIAHYLRHLHNLACDLAWLAWPILAKRVWPKIRAKRRRAVTAEEHANIIASEKNLEKRVYYDFLDETGAAQSDAAELTAENIDLQEGLLSTFSSLKLCSFLRPIRHGASASCCEGKNLDIANYEFPGARINPCYRGVD